MDRVRTSTNRKMTAVVALILLMVALILPAAGSAEVIDRMVRASPPSTGTSSCKAIGTKLSAMKPCSTAARLASSLTTIGVPSSTA